jgi:DNA-binding NarL/FixJ family response regulator
MTVIGEASTVRGAVARVNATLPDVVVLDVRLPDGTGVDACRQIRSAHPEIPCLMLTAFADESVEESALLAGAHGWLLKDVRGIGLTDAVRRVAAGEQLIRADLLQRARERLLQRSQKQDEIGLTRREQQVLTLITEGMTNRQIGEQLGLVEKTVKNYVSVLFDKLGLERRTQAVVYGLDHPAND